jgi:hypothetical protein
MVLGQVVFMGFAHQFKKQTLKHFILVIWLLGYGNKKRGKRKRGKMEIDIVVALISLIGTMGGSFGGILISNKLTNYRIEQLEKKVEKHNKVVERVYVLEKDKAVFEEEMTVANHRITDPEQYHK